MLVLAVVLSMAAESCLAAAFFRGSVYLDDGGLWTYYPSWPNTANANGCALIFKCVGLNGAGHFLLPAPNLVVLHDGHRMSWSDGNPVPFGNPRDVSEEIFTDDDGELSEIAPMRSGNYLVAERWNSHAKAAELIEFNLTGRVAEYAFPEVVDATNDRVIGAMHIELLGDQCTVLYTTGSDTIEIGRVRRMNICSGKPQADFTTLLAASYGGAIRQLPGGDVLVATGNAIQRFISSGQFVESYQLLGATHIALSSDGEAFYAAGVDADREEFQRFDVATGSSTAITIGNPGMSPPDVPPAVSDLVTVGEWRISAPPPPRPRAVRRGR